MTCRRALTKPMACAVVMLMMAAWSGGSRAEQSAATEGASLADWQTRIAAAPAVERASVQRRFAAVRDRLARDERVPQVLRFPVSGEAFRAACAAEEAGGAPLGIKIWKDDEEQVVAAVPPSSRRRLKRAGISGEVLYGSVADWRRARRAGRAAARRIEPYYLSAEAARELVPTVLVFDLVKSAPGALAPSSGLLDRESVLRRNASYLAYLDTVPADQRREVLRVYSERGFVVAGLFTLEEFPEVAERFFPEWKTAGGGGATVAAAAQSGPPYDGAFHSYEEVDAELHDLATRFPDIAKVMTLGPSYEGRELWALKVSSNVDTDDPAKPDVLFTGCHHAREWISVEPPMYFARLLTESYATDSEIRALVDQAEIWLVPIVNPDGLTYSQLGPDASNDPFRMWRKNMQPIEAPGCAIGIGVDLNRNYPFMFRVEGDLPCPSYGDDIGGKDAVWSPVYRGPEAASELEVQHLIALTGHPDRNFTARVDFHNFSRQVLHPWSFTTEPSPDRPAQGTLSRFLAQQLTTSDWSPYIPGQSLGYLASGTSNDYAYGVEGVLAAFVLELRPGPGNGWLWRDIFPCPSPKNCFHVPESQIDPVNREAWAAARRLIEWSIDPVCSPASAEVYAYVADRAANTVTVIDPALALSDPGNAVVQTVSVDGGPAALALTPDGAFAYVARADADAVSVLSTADAIQDPATAEVGTIAVGDRPVAIAMRPDGAFAYVANEGSGDVSVIDVATRTVTATIDVDDEPRGIAVSPDAAFVFVTSFASDTLSRIDTMTNTVTGTVQIPGAGPTAVTVTADSVIVYVTAEKLGSVLGYSPSLDSLGDPWEVGELPDGVAASPDAAIAYVVNRGSGTVSILAPYGPTEPFAAATSKGVSEAVSIVAPSAAEQSEAVSVGQEPVRVTFTPDGVFAWVANRADGTISIVDTASRTVAGTLAVGGSPTDIAIEWLPSGCQVLPTPAPKAPSTPTLSPTPTRTPSSTPTATVTATPEFIPCAGDCDGADGIAVNELVTLVNIALGQAPVDDCGAGDGDGDEEISIAELITAVNNALNGCASRLSPSRMQRGREAAVAVRPPSSLGSSTTRSFIAAPLDESKLHPASSLGTPT